MSIKQNVWCDRDIVYPQLTDIVSFYESTVGEARHQTSIGCAVPKSLSVHACVAHTVPLRKHRWL
jgi:hypothetical protein